MNSGTKLESGRVAEGGIPPQARASSSPVTQVWEQDPEGNGAVTEGAASSRALICEPLAFRFHVLNKQELVLFFYRFHMAEAACEVPALGLGARVCMCAHVCVWFFFKSAWNTVESFLTEPWLFWGEAMLAKLEERVT